MHKIKWFTQNLKRRKFHSTSTEDGRWNIQPVNDIISTSDTVKEKTKGKMEVGYEKGIM